jgi:leucyl-tRNA synthetase
LVEEKDNKFFDKATGEELKKVIAKMSKSLKNVVNPDEIVEEYGADTLRLYEMYMADFKDSAPWDTKNIVGVKRFLEKVERAFNSVEAKFAEDDLEAIKLLNKTIRKVEGDIENYKFNTAIASMMILANYGRPTDELLFSEWKEKFVVILSAFAPFLAEELYAELCKDVSLKHLNKKSVFFAKWPEIDESMLIENTVKIAVQVL